MVDTMEKKTNILDCIEEEVNGLTEEACRKWLKRYKQAMFLIHGKLYPKSAGTLECYINGEKDANKTNQMNTTIEAKSELSKEIAKIMSEYNVNYAGDILGTCNSPLDNLKQWEEYFEDRGGTKHGEELSKWMEQYFAELRFSDKYHLGLGDIRLTVAQQEELINKIKSMNNGGNNA